MLVTGKTLTHCEPPGFTIMATYNLETCREAAAEVARRKSAIITVRDRRLVPRQRELLAAPLSVLGLTLRAYNALLNNGFSTVGDGRGQDGDGVGKAAIPRADDRGENQGEAKRAELSATRRQQLGGLRLEDPISQDHHGLPTPRTTLRAGLRRPICGRCRSPSAGDTCRTSCPKGQPSLFELTCAHDLEGVVTKRLRDGYGSRARWLKIKNSGHSQNEGRRELFDSWRA